MSLTFKDFIELMKEVINDGLKSILIFIFFLIVGIILSPIGVILYLQFRNEAKKTKVVYKDLIESFELESFRYANHCFKSSFIYMINNCAFTIPVRTSSSKRKKRIKTSRSEYPKGLAKQREEFSSKLIEIGIKEHILNRDIDNFNNLFVDTFKYSESCAFELIFSKETNRFDIKVNVIEAILCYPITRMLVWTYNKYDKARYLTAYD